MLKKIIIIIIIILALLSLAGLFLFGAPYIFYNDIVNKKEMSSWFTLSNHRDLLITPTAEVATIEKKPVNDRLWKKFHFKTVNIPLPVKHPLYFVAPIIKYNEKQKKSEFGVSLFNASNEVLAQFYFLPAIDFPYLLNSQKIFELPIVAAEIQKVDQDKVWRDIFAQDISEWDIEYSKMVYHLYIMQLRSVLINEKTIRYYFIKELNKAVLELEYPDKDYKSELILSRRGGQIFSFLLITKINNPEAQVIRNMALHGMTYLDTTPNMANYIYNEFKALSFREQTDHLGMLYLLSSWSHDQKRLEILVSAIQYLERGVKNQRQLEPLYEYLFKRVGKTFSKRYVEGVNLDSNVLLKRNTELEELVKRTLENEDVIPEKSLSVKEQYEKIIQETRNRIKKKSNKIFMN